MSKLPYASRRRARSGGDDCVQTPTLIAERAIAHFNPRGVILEPARGHGHIYRALCEHAKDDPHSRVDWCEISAGRDFIARTEPCDWVFTNPPFSAIGTRKKARPGFLEHAFCLAPNVVFYVPLSHALAVSARWNLLDDYGFALVEIARTNTPTVADGWPARYGFQMAWMHWQYGGDPTHIRHTDWRTYTSVRRPNFHTSPCNTPSDRFNNGPDR